jgi:hypothetical protein
MAEIRDTLVAICGEHHPLSDRGVFYQAEVLGCVRKSEADYKGTVIRLLVDMRRRGRIPWDWIVDNTRWRRKPHTHSSIEAALEETARSYRRAIWDNQDNYVEIWMEKDALAGTVYPVTAEYDVPLMVARGYSSHAFLHSAANEILGQGKPAYIYAFGDFDPSGVDATRFIEQTLREYAPGAEIHFERVAVTPAQIERWHLATRPTKTTDSRSKRFGSQTSVELDAIPPNTLRDLVRDCIEQHLDERALAALIVAEESEKEWMRKLLRDVATRQVHDDG